MTTTRRWRIGVIADTHGLLRPEALAFLQGCDALVHAGDIGNADILSALQAIAPLCVVRGNNDTADWTSALPLRARRRFGAVTIEVIHDQADFSLGPDDACVDIVISGHSHKPAIDTRDGVIYFNPGSAGPRRFRLPVSIGEIVIEGATPIPRLVQLVPVPT